MHIVIWFKQTQKYKAISINLRVSAFYWAFATTVHQWWGSKKKVQVEKDFELTKYLLKLVFLVRIKSSMLNVKGLAIEDETFDFFLNIKIFLYLNLFSLKPFPDPNDERSDWTQIGTS